MIEGAPELWIGEVAELAGEQGSLSGAEEDLAALGQGADLVGGEERAAGMLLGMGQPRTVAVEIAPCPLEDDGFLPEEVGDEARALMMTLFGSPILLGWLPFGWPSDVATIVMDKDPWDAGLALMRAPFTRQEKSRRLLASIS